jgi:hypothetical protein
MVQGGSFWSAAALDVYLALGTAVRVTFWLSGGQMSATGSGT